MMIQKVIQKVIHTQIQDSESSMNHLCTLTVKLFLYDSWAIQQSIHSPLSTYYIQLDLKIWTFLPYTAMPKPRRDARAKKLLRNYMTLRCQYEQRMRCRIFKLRRQFC